MTVEELKAEAIKRYPIGTKYQAAHLYREGREDDATKYSGIISSHEFRQCDEHDISFRENTTNNYVACVYDRGFWAVIISLPEPEVPKQLPIFN